jgi:ABC-type Fe3+/spermidine/putrescine transport system ATPase subunit
MAKPIAVENLVKSYDGVIQAVAGVSFRAEAGTITTLLGPSGCGKTTTLRCIAGLETPSMGEIRFGDRVMFSSGQGTDVPTEQRGIGMMFQNYALWPHMTVAQNVAFGLRLRKFSAGEVEALVRGALDLVRLAERADAYPGQMSGGQQQRVALARALAYDPEVLLLDEPLANLDAKLREEMRYELAEVQARTGVTVLYVTHDQSEAMTLSSKIIVMQDGHIAHQGSPQEIYERPKNRFVAEFVGVSNLIEVEAATDEGERVLGKTALGTLAALRSQAGAVRFFMIRPEDVEVASGRLNGRPNQIHARIAERIYLGDTVVLLADAAGGHRIRAHVRREHPATPGTEVILRLPPQHLVALEG